MEKPKRFVYFHKIGRLYRFINVGNAECFAEMARARFGKKGEDSIVEIEERVRVHRRPLSLRSFAIPFQT